MLKTLSRILPFFIVTLLAVGGVELFYKAAERYLLAPVPVPAEKRGQATGPAGAAGPAERHRNYDVIVERNLFQSYLKEPEPQVEEAPANPLEGLEATTLDLVLMGTISGEEGQGRAIILNKKENEQEIYYRGDVVEGAEIKEILRGKVILSYQGRDQILDMSEAASMRSKYSSAVSEPFPGAGANLPPRRRVVPVQPEDVVEEAVEPEPLELEPEEAQIGEPIEPVEEPEGVLPVPPESVNEAGGTMEQQEPPAEAGQETGN